MSDVKHPIDELDAFNKKFRNVDCVGEWLVYFAGFTVDGTGRLLGAWIGSKPLMGSEVALLREVIWVTTIFGRQIYAEDMVTRHGRRELEHVTTEARDRLLAEIDKKARG